MKKKYTWIAVISAILAVASAAAAIVVFLKMKKKKVCPAAPAADADFDDYDIDFLLDNDDDVSELNLENVAEYADDEEDAKAPAEEAASEE